MAVDKIPVKWITIPVSVILFIMFAYVGARLGLKCSQKYGRQRKGEEGQGTCISPKVLDTSVIIDGRIFDILKTGVIEGDIVIPEFVLSELRHIADSADDLKRTKGRRGLDILKKIQTELDIPVEISEVDYEDMPEVDAKLLRLSKQLEATVITNDFNLNKVASVQGVRVFNINELANAGQADAPSWRGNDCHGRQRGQGIWPGGCVPRRWHDDCCRECKRQD